MPQQFQSANEMLPAEICPTERTRIGFLTVA